MLRPESKLIFMLVEWSVRTDDAEKICQLVHFILWRMGKKRPLTVASAYVISAAFSCHYTDCLLTGDGNWLTFFQ
jgi:hypothetical protein